MLRSKVPSRGINAHGVIVRIADNDIAIAIDAQAAGPAVTKIGRGPGDAEEFAVAIERLNAGGPIDDVEMVVRARWRWRTA